MDGPLIVDDTGLMIQAALDGVGLAFLAEQHVEPHLTTGAFVRVLQNWCPPFPDYFVYYPSRRQQPAALTRLSTRFVWMVDEPDLLGGRLA